jgi:hypothetical protein
MLGKTTGHIRSPMSNFRSIFVWSLYFLSAVVAVTFASGSADAQDTIGAAPTASQAPVAYTSVSELNGILDPLKQAAESMQADLGKMRIDKWKTDASTKKQTLANIESIQRNLQSALPGTIAQVSNSPEDVGASFKLYRNLDALYDVFGSVVESAGAFGSKDEFQSLGNDMTALEKARRTFGERLQKLTVSKEDELTRLRAQVKTLSAAPPPPPKKVVVDDTEAPKKPPVKKKPAAKPKPPTTPTNASPSATPTN